VIPVEQKRDVSSSGVEGTSSFEISGKDAAHIMTILRDTLYSDKVLAVLREYASNAWDANRMAGRGEEPIEIHLPSYGDPTLRIKDHGPGLSLDDVFEVYNKYGASTKRDSNTAVGMLGIGSKSGFAYSDSFTIVSWHQGSKSTYVAVIDDSEKGRVDLFAVEDCDPSLSGVEIQIPIKPHDISEFDIKAKSLFAYFEPRPKINTVIPPIQTGKDFPGLGRILDIDLNDYRSPRGKWVAIMGCVPYTINLNQLRGLSSSASSLSGILWFDIGTLQVAASREELKYGDTTKENLANRINEIIDRYVAFLLEGVDKLSQWERRIRIKKIRELHLNVPGQYSDYGNDWIQFDRTADAFFKLKGKGWKGKIDSLNGFRVESKNRFVYRDEKRVLNGYEFQDGDIVIDPVNTDLLARKELKAQITKHLIEGIPMVNISKLKWVKPVSNARPMDAARAKAQMLVLDPKAIHADRKSERWTPVSRVPLDSDVYVVLDSFVVASFSDFYETYENDRLLIEGIGGKMPDVVGYRNTQAHPVVRAKLKGKDYKQWRDDDFVKLLLAQPGVPEAVRAKVWGSDISAYSVDEAALAVLDVDHPVRSFVKKVLDAKKAYHKIDRKMHPIVNRVSLSSKGNEAQKEWEELVKLYPLLAIPGSRSVEWVSSSHADKWFDYIKMVDLHRQMDDLVKQVKGSEDSNEEKAA
jgi:hypothetical protein